MDFAFPDELGHLCANTETLPDASDDDFQVIDSGMLISNKR
jgi:hypothetical protein